MTTPDIPDPLPMEIVVDGLRYRTSAGRRVAFHWRPGHALRYYSTARRIHLFLTTRGNYFCQEQETQADSPETGPFGWSRIRPLSRPEALLLYLESDHKLAPVEEVFPGADFEA